ncbi:MAG TPA: helix-turn-helix transcriptional regulator [Candidatus Limnocylindria bacterium]|jgi:DNA-binding XRE family transcriptional regulator|nr:helix-turn-helix transcriptional regulator [Candidatus Limnocylindria bacterium]
METETRPEASLSALLRERRRQLRPDTTTLGFFERHPQRIGKRVTQEEIAEAAGVSRVWYGLLEGAAKVNASPALLSRLAEVLMLDEAERIALLHAAIPGLKTT